MNCSIYQVYIEYDRPTGTYQSVKLRRNGDPTLTWQTGDPCTDWKSCIDFATKLNLQLQETLSVRAFVCDVPGWTFDHSDMLQPVQRVGVVTEGIPAYA